MSKDEPIETTRTLVKLIVEDASVIGDFDEIKEFNSEMEERNLRAKGLNINDDDDNDLEYSGQLNVENVLSVFEFIIGEMDAMVGDHLTVTKNTNTICS